MWCSKGRIFAILCLLICGTSCWAQYHPTYSQYMFNGMAINPAYAGSKEVLNLAALYRCSQWKNVDGAPVTQTFTGDFPLKNPQIALGLLVYNDQVGIYRQTGVFASYAFRVKLGSGKLSFGLQAGFEQMREDESKVTLRTNPDPMFNNEVHKSFMPNVGTGVYYYTPQYFVGLSLPQLLTYSPYTADSYKGKMAFDNVMLYGGILFPVNDKFKIRPSALLQYAQKEILCDLNCNVILFPGDRLELGVSYRNASTLAALVEVRINPRLSLGYAYDHTFGVLNETISGSHEIMVRYEFRYRVKAENPLFLSR